MTSRKLLYAIIRPIYYLNRLNFCREVKCLLNSEIVLEASLEKDFVILCLDCPNFFFQVSVPIG